ncbi:hypothetical protein BGZ49_000509 [Haplosporangium sp. Z 27]|nr:hypothetical protein BGZ49_000509 [Haplosporangium sp. Z 27]
MDHSKHCTENVTHKNAQNHTNFNLQEQGGRNLCRRQLIFPNEILEMIIQQSSQATIRHSASLVSKQWNLICSQFIQRSGVWRAWASAEAESQEELDLLEEMPTLHRLICSISAEPSADPATRAKTRAGIESHLVKEGKACIKAWNRFTKLVTAPIQDINPNTSNKIPVSQRQCLLHYIQHLTIRGIQIMDVKFLDQLLPIGLKYIRTIQLEYQTIGTIRLFTLLDSAPFLESLTVKCPADKTIQISADAFSDKWSTVARSGRDAFEVHSNDDVGTLSLDNPPPGIKFDEPRLRQKKYRLQHFNVTNVSIAHYVLERLVMSCPDLLTFKVQEVNRTFISQDQGVDRRMLRLGLYRTVLLELCSRFCKRIEWFHLSSFSKDDDGMEGRHLDLVKRFMPNQSTFLTRTFCTSQVDVLPPEPRLLQIYNTITLLRVHPTAGNTSFSSGQMSRLLCFMPNLLHLYARETLILTSDLELTSHQPPHINNSGNDNNNDGTNANDMDVNTASHPQTNESQEPEIIPSSPTSLSDPTVVSESSPVSWACKNLKTLEVRIGLQRIPTFVDHFMMYCPRITRIHLGMSRLIMGRRAETETDSTYNYVGPDVKNLVALTHLEEITFSVRHIRGEPDIADMEFMRPRNNICGSNSDSNSSNDNGNENNVEGTGEGSELHTVWPQLTVFRVRYNFSKDLEDFSEFESALEAMRPGVEFRIRKPFFTS